MSTFVRSRCFFDTLYKQVPCFYLRRYLKHFAADRTYTPIISYKISIQADTLLRWERTEAQADVI